MSFFSCPDCGEKISLKDKKCNNCNTEFSDELKKKILTMKVIIAVGGGFLIFGIILYFLFKTDSSDISNKELLNYNTNYYMQEDNNYYIMFFKKTDTTGTCYMQVSTESCNYEIVDNNKIIINSEMTNRGVKLKMYSAYNIIDKDTIKRVEINISSKDINPSPTADDTIFTTDYDSTEKKEFTLNAPYYKKYSLAGDSKNPKATIEFLSASVCDIDFSKSAKSVDIGRREYMHISYTKGLCTYEKLNDYDLKIKYTGTFSIIHPVSQLSVYNIPVFNNVNNEMRITFEEGYNSFNITNGKWAYSNFALYFKDDTTNDKDDDTNNDNSVNSDVNNDNNQNSSSGGNASNSNTDKNENNNQDTSLKPKYEYRYRDRKEEVKWSSWSNWSTNKVSATDNKEVETREVEKQTYKTIYKYKHYICPKPTTLTPYGNATPYDANCSGGYWEYVESEYVFKKGGNSSSVGCNNGYGGYFDYKKYSTMTKKEQCWFQDKKEEIPDKVVNVTEYRYRVKSVNTTWGDWSNWSSTEYKETENRQVEVRRVS